MSNELVGAVEEVEEQEDIVELQLDTDDLDVVTGGLSDCGGCYCYKSSCPVTPE